MIRNLMPVSKKIPVEEHRLGVQYLELCETLRSPTYRRHLEKRLGFWVKPSDKRLPIVLLGRTIGEILGMSSGELLRFPSIGEKKFSALITLLLRVVNTPESKLPSFGELAVNVSDVKSGEIDHELCWNLVSEFEWNTWQRVVCEQGLEHEKIGRLCKSLNEIPRVLWNKTLGTYCRVSLEELRAMKTYGERRVHAILHLFHDIFEIASKFNGVPRLKVRMSLRWIDEIQQWMTDVLEQPAFPTRDELLRRFVQPCLTQLRIDATEGVIQLAEARLGLKGPITSVRQVAKEMNLARARVYQLLGQINEIMSVRWPEGGNLVYRLRDKCIYEMIDQPATDAHEIFMAAAELFYPSYRSAPVSNFFRETQPQNTSQNSFSESHSTIPLS